MTTNEYSDQFDNISKKKKCHKKTTFRLCPTEFSPYLLVYSSFRHETNPYSAQMTPTQVHYNYAFCNTIHFIELIPLKSI